LLEVRKPGLTSFQFLDLFITPNELAQSLKMAGNVPALAMWWHSFSAQPGTVDD
jgi:hypothetical protein